MHYRLTLFKCLSPNTRTYHRSGRVGPERLFRTADHVTVEGEFTILDSRPAGHFSYTSRPHTRLTADYHTHTRTHTTLNVIDPTDAVNRLTMFSENPFYGVYGALRRSS